MACSGSGVQSDRGTEEASSARAEAALLRLDDLPEHWSVSASGGDAALQLADCALDALDERPAADTSGFEHVSGDSLHQAVMIFESDDEAERFLREFLDSGDCMEERGKQGADEGAEVTVRELAVPDHGDRAIGLRWEGSANGRSAFSDVIAIRVGDAVALLALARLYSPPDLANTELLGAAAGYLSS